MRPFVLRDEEPPGDAIVVVRGGLLTVASIHMTAERCRRQYGIYGLSVFGAIDVSLETLVAQVPQLGPDRYRQLRMSTCGRLRAAGFPLWPMFGRPHFTIVMPDLATATIDRLASCFGDPFENPGLSPLS